MPDSLDYDQASSNFDNEVLKQRFLHCQLGLGVAPTRILSRMVASSAGVRDQLILHSGVEFQRLTAVGPGWYRLHQEQSTGQQLAAEGSQDQAIGHPPARSSSSASEDQQLLAEDEKFEIAIGGWAVTEDEELDQQANEGIEEGQQHGRAD